MKPELLKMSRDPLWSFSVRHDKVPYFLNKWHYHAEMELLCIKKGSGIKFIGDHISRFKPGDVMLIGANLPHYFHCDKSYFAGTEGLFAEATVTHFLPCCFGARFLELPEMKGIRKLLEQSKTGLQITGRTRGRVAEILDGLRHSSGSERLLGLMRALHIISGTTDQQPLASSGFHTAYSAAETERLGDIYKYSIDHIHRKVSLAEIAKVAYISPNAFCRYFKAQTNKTYSQFLIEIKIGIACKLLTENEGCIKNICYESGFNSFSNFNKYFKAITGHTPLAYKKKMCEGVD